MKENYAIIDRQWPLGPPRPRGKTTANRWTKPGLVKKAMLGQIFGLIGVHLANVG